MMHKLKSMGVINLPFSNQLDILEKVAEKVVIGGASTKGNCSVQEHNIDTTLSQSGNTQRLQG